MIEKSLAPELPLVDVRGDLLWHRQGEVSLAYRLEAWHEPGMDDLDFNTAARLADDVFGSLPETTSYQFLVLVDEKRGRRALEDLLAPIMVVDERTRTLEEIRRGRLAELLTGEADVGGMVQLRRHYLVATFRPSVFKRTWWGLRRGPADARGRERAAQTVLAEAARFNAALEVRLLQMGLGFERLDTASLVALTHELLSPTASEAAPLRSIPEDCGREWVSRGRARREPWLGETSPTWALLEDDVVVRRQYVRVGDYYVGVVSLKLLPDETEPGQLMVPLLHLSRRKYQIVYRVEIPDSVVERDRLEGRAQLAGGLQLKNFLGRDRKDAEASAVARETEEVIEASVQSTQRVLGVGLQLAIFEDSPEGVDVGVEDVLGKMALAYGLRATRETYDLKRSWISMLPGAPAMRSRVRRGLTPTATDLLPTFDFRWGRGVVPFLTPKNSVVLLDLFDRELAANSNWLVTGESGHGKSFAAMYVQSGYAIAAEAQGKASPYSVILDNGGSFERWAQLSGGRYVQFSFDQPPVFPIFEWDPEAGSLDEHISRLQWLLLDFFRVEERDAERFEACKAILERALRRHLYGSDLPKDFEGFEAALVKAREETVARSGRTTSPVDGLLDALYPFTEGKFARFFKGEGALQLDERAHTVCIDFKGLGEHRDLALVAQRLTIFSVWQWAARMARRHHRTFLTIDESWGWLDKTGRGAVGDSGSVFLGEVFRQGRKAGLSVCAISQQLVDFARSAHGAAILGNSGTRLVGRPDKGGMEALREHLKLTDRQCGLVEGLKRLHGRWADFLLVRGDRVDVIRVPADPLSRWIFTTDDNDRARIAEVQRAHPELDLLEQMQLLASKEGR